ncbi:MAG TPA: hypothetical protein VIX41_08905 [Acidimicrobiales bacterium]
MSEDDLVSIDVRSGVNERGEAFCTIVVASSPGGRILLGQLSPSEVRGMAMAWLESAEAAEQDAAVLRVIRKLELPDELAGAVVIELRQSRDET